MASYKEDKANNDVTQTMFTSFDVVDVLGWENDAILISFAGPAPAGGGTTAVQLLVR